MRKYKFLIVFITLFTLFSYNKVFARSVSNYDTTYSMSIDEIESLNDDYNDEYTYRELLDYFSNFTSDYYNILVRFNFTDDSFSKVYLITFDLFPKSLSSIDLSLYGYLNNDKYFFTYYFRYTSGFKEYSFNIPYIGNDIFNNTAYLGMLNCLNNNSGCHKSSNYFLESNFHNFLSTISNTSSYEFDYDYYNGSLIYSSTIPIILTNNNNFSNSSITQWYKTTIINDTTYNINDILPTYKDLFPDESTIDLNKELDNYNSLSNFYFRINKSDISNFNFSYEFNPNYSLFLSVSNPNYFDDFYDELSSEVKFFGRIYNSTNNYYTYESINCTLTHQYIKNTSSITSSGNNLSCTSDLTNYDYIFVYFRQFVISTNNSATVIGLNTTVNGALYHYSNNLNGYIYDLFSNVPSNFKMSFSSNYLDSALVLSNVLNGANAEYFNYYNESYIPLAQNDFPFRLAYGYSKSNYYVVYGDSSVYSGTRNIEVFIGENTIISFNNNDNSKTFYIYEQDKTISEVNSNIQYNLNINYGESYDLNYYFKQVNNYINGLSNQITNFGNLTQNMYDNLPDFLQIFIFVSFVLFCVYFTFKLIKK